MVLLLLAAGLASAHPPMCPAPPPPCKDGAKPRPDGKCPCTAPPPPRTVLMTMDVTDAINASGSWTTINWVRIPTVAQMGGANSSTIMAMAQCRFRVCHATARGGALDPHCPTGNGIGGSPDYMDLCSRVSHDDGRTWGPLATNVTGGLWAGMIASGAEARNDTDGRSADPNLLWDAKRGKMLLFFDTRNPNQTSWVTSSSDGVQWAPATRVNTGYNTVRTPPCPPTPPPPLAASQGF